MEFRRLKASITNNSGQQPSLYMALCMVESLFQDIEDESGAPISQNPVGDERLPNKLIWLMRSINGIYKDKDADLQRNRGKLEKTKAEMDASAAALGELSGIAKELAAAEREYAQLDRQLREKGEKKRKCDEIRVMCDQVRAQLAELMSFDESAAKAELADLLLKAQAAAAAKAEKEAELARARDLCVTQERELHQIQSAQEEAESRNRELLESLVELRGKADNAKKTMEQLEQEKTGLQGNLEDLGAQRDEVQRTADELREKIRLFRQDILLPAMGEVDEIRKELDELQKSKAEAVEGLGDVDKIRNQLVLEIARLKSRMDVEQDQLKDTQDRAEKLQAEKKALEDTLNAAVQSLNVLQAETERLKRDKLPEVQKLEEQERQRHQEIVEMITTAENRQKELESAIADLEQQLPELEGKVRSHQAIYDSLTANYTAKTKELEALERQITELRNKSDEEKLEIYRRQLEGNLRELTAIQEECTRIQQENGRLVQLMESHEAERSRLLELKRKHETGKTAVEGLLQELTSISTEEFLSEVTVICERQNLLESVRGKLAASVGAMRQAMGCVPVQEDLPLDGQMKTALNQLRICTDDLRCALIHCANSLKMEEK